MRYYLKDCELWQEDILCGGEERGGEILFCWGSKERKYFEGENALLLLKWVVKTLLQWPMQQLKQKCAEKRKVKPVKISQTNLFFFPRWLFYRTLMTIVCWTRSNKWWSRQYIGRGSSLYDLLVTSIVHLLTRTSSDGGVLYQMSK